MFVYGPRVYHPFITLATQLTTITYQSSTPEDSDEHAHTLLLLLMIILLFSSDFQIHTVENSQINQLKLKEKLVKIQQHYVEIACRFIHDQFGFTIGKRMFQKLVPILQGK